MKQRKMKKPVKDYGLSFYPKVGTLLMCDFCGNIVPEIVKRRPVVVMTPPLIARSKLAIVVPLSTTAPKIAQHWHVKLKKNYHPNEDDNLDVWAKCDLITHVSLSRLDRFKVEHRKYLAPCIDSDDLEAIRKGIKSAFGF